MKLIVQNVTDIIWSYFDNEDTVLETKNGRFKITSGGQLFYEGVEANRTIRIESFTDNDYFESNYGKDKFKYNDKGNPKWKFKSDISIVENVEFAKEV